MAANNRDPLWMRIVVDVVTRIAYFVLGFLSPLLVTCYVYARVGRHTYRSVARNALTFPTQSAGIVLTICLALGVVAALFGPALYRSYAERGRGTLEQTKRGF